jgi:hypothetical protein
MAGPPRSMLQILLREMSSLYPFRQQLEQRADA